MVKKIVNICQARMTSTRLPGKILKPILDKPCLEYQIERMQRSKKIHALVIATTTLPTDDPVVELCNKLGVAYFRGSETHVLERYAKAANQHGAQVVVRTTGDCPLIDPAVMDEVVESFLSANPPVDYASNSFLKTYPHGMDLEVFTNQALQTAYQEATQGKDIEHVSYFITDHHDRFSCLHVASKTKYPHYRLTLDYPQDFTLLEKIISTLYPKNPQFSLKDVVDLLTQHPDWALINQSVGH